MSDLLKPKPEVKDPDKPQDILDDEEHRKK